MTVEVDTSAGRVRGRWEEGVAVFRGVPFAAPPVGPHRFAPPQPVTPWDGVREAFRFGPPPPQPAIPTDGDDWLNLTVWTPDPGRAGLPVVVWISGGGYLNCDSANPHLAGAALASAGAVIVSAHYRSGAEGFLRLAGAPDNRALLDQLAALAWVHTDIAAFGGDPGNVTVLGQSAGAGSIAALLVMPAAAGAFRRAILQSIPGTYFTPELADDVAAEICGELGCAPAVAAAADVVHASHGLDTLLVFGTTDIHGEVTAAGPAALARTRQLSRTIRADHLAFAATGDPGWPRFRRRDRRTRVYDPEPALMPYPEERSRTIWRDQRFGVLDLQC